MRIPVPTAMATAGTLPPRIDLALYQGDDFFLRIVLEANENPIDLTGYTPKAEIRATAGSDVVLAAFACTVVDPATLELHLTSALSTALPATGAWDVQIEDSVGLVTTLAYGSVTVAKEVTT